MGSAESHLVAGVFPGDSQRDEDLPQILTPDLLERTWLDLEPSPDLDMPWEKGIWGKHFLQQAALGQPATEVEAFGMSARPATGTTGKAYKGGQAIFGGRPLEANHCQYRCSLLERRPRS